MSVTPEMIAELRSQFYAKTPNWAEEIHPADADRIKDDAWLKKFLDHQEQDVDMAMQMLHETCVWRKSFGVNDISDSNANAQYLSEGLFYPRGKDIDGYTVFIFKSKKHSKGKRDDEELKRCVIYWFERLDRMDKSRRISVFFDMGESGLSNMDMDFTKYLINLFKFYYPDFLNYILIYEMPWVLSAAFKVIKALLPAKAVAKMKFINKDSVREFIPERHVQKSWGGPDDYEYVFAPGLTAASEAEPAPDAAAKKVTFAEPGSPSEENPPDILGRGDEGGESKISLSPHDVILFTKDGDDMTASFALTNTHSSCISFKIKTTSPEKFRVRPSTGALAPGATQPIGLMVLEGYHYPAVCKEKFLVMCIPVATVDLTAQDLSVLWKGTANTHVELHRLRCTFPAKMPLKNGSVSKVTSSVTSSEPEVQSSQYEPLSASKNSQDALDVQLKSLKTIQLVNLTLTATLLCLFVYFFWYSTQRDDSMGEFCVRP